MSDRAPVTSPGRLAEVFWVFLRLGLASFGGPVAHLGFFRTECVHRRRWLSDSDYAELISLCQFLPGPTSSQVSMALGLRRAGWAGLLAAWVAFTASSAVLMLACAYGVTALGELGGWIGGLKAAAVAVVIHALWGMARSLATGTARVVIALAACALVLLLGGPLAQVVAIVVGAALGLWWCRAPAATSHLRAGVPLPVAVGCLALWLALLVLLPLLAATKGSGGVVLADMFYRAGSLVFGGGHVVLPLLQAETAAFVDAGRFLAGYGAAQAVPGPLFTFAVYVGAVVDLEPHGWVGAIIALVGIFLPAGLLVVAGLGLWDRLGSWQPARRAMAGMGAAVVGILGAALVDPVVPTGISSPATAAIAGLALVALFRKAPPWAVVAVAAFLGWALVP